MRFDKDEAETSGRVRLFVDDEEVGSEHLPATFEHLIAFQGLDVGADGLSPVREGGKGRYPFSGRMDRVIVEILDDTEPASSVAAGTSGGSR